MAVMATMAAIILSALFMSYRLDARDQSKSSVARRMNNSSNMLSLYRRKTTGGEEGEENLLGNVSLIGKVAPIRNVSCRKKEVSGEQGEENVVDQVSVVGKVPPGHRRRRNNVARHKTREEVKKLMNINTKSDIAIIEESIPRILGSQSLGSKFAGELKQHHRWMAIVFYYSDAFPRALRVISLATNIIIMLFIQSITYNLTNPDDGSCEALETEEKCLEPVSPYATGEPKCMWEWQDPEQHYWTDEAIGDCSLIPPDSSIKIVLFVALFSAIVSTPIALSLDWIIQNILAAPLKSRADIETLSTVDIESRYARRSDSNSSGRASDGGRLQSATSAMIRSMKANAELDKLSAAIVKHRETLEKDQLNEFDGK